MLTLIPLQFLSLFAFFVLRITLGAVCILIGRRMLRDREAPGYLSILGSALVIFGIQCGIGFYTQVAVLFIGLISFFGTTGHTFRAYVPRSTLFLMGVIAFSLFITGAGAFSFDLPL